MNNTRLSLSVPSQVDSLITLFEKNGYEIYVVGGVVRDIFLDRMLTDWDFTTNAKPEEILALVPDSFYDNSFGTVGVKSEGKPYEITTFRTEASYSDGRHPDQVGWGKDLEEDLKRRDFTINSMALKRVVRGKYEVIDVFGGQDDLKQKLIKTVGDPDERFAEDSLRMMRAVRIAAQLKFGIDENAFLSIQKKAAEITRVSWERIRDEFLKIMASECPADGYMILRNCGLAGQILPEIEASFGVEQKSPGRHHIFDVGTHLVESLRHCPSTDPITRFATLVHDTGKTKTQRKFSDGRITFYNHEMESEKIAKKIAERFKFSNYQTDKFVKLVRWHQFTVDERQTDSAIRRFIRNVGIDNLKDMLDLRVGDRLGGGARETSWRLEEFKRRLLEVQTQPFSIQDLKISGRDVMEIFEIKPGPLVGKYLQMLFEEVENGLPNEPEALVSRLKQIRI